MNINNLRQELSESDCEMILHVTDALGIKGEIPTILVYLVDIKAEACKVLLLSKADVARGLTWRDVLRPR